MNTSNDQNVEDGSNIVCSECGQNICIVEDTGRAWFHRSRVIPFVVWVIVAMVLFVSASPWSQGRLGNNYAYWENTEPSRASWVNYSEKMVALDRLIEADGGDLSGRDDLVGWLGELIEEESIDNELMRIRFVSKAMSGTILVDDRYGFGGIGYSKMVMANVSDVRDPGSYNSTPYMLLEPSSGGFPWEVIRINHNGAEYIKDTYNPVGVLAQISLCLVAVFGVGVIGRFVGVEFAKRGRLALFVACLIGTTIYAVLRPHQFGYSPLHGAEQSSTGEYTLGEIRGALGHDDGLSALIGSMSRELGMVDEHDGLVVCAAIDRGYVTHTDTWMSGLSQHQPLVRLGKQSFYESEPIVAANQIEPPVHLRGEPRFDVSGLYWWEVRLGGGDALYWISFSPGYICLVLVVLYLFWRMVHWISRAVLRRIQRRRVGRDQCVYCAYPLIKEALASRGR